MTELVVEVHRGLGLRRGGGRDWRGRERPRWKPREGVPLAFCIHTTGYGPIRRYLDDDERERFGYESPFDAAVRLYSRVMVDGPELLVDGETGRVARFCEPDIAATHVGSGDWRRYRRPEKQLAREPWFPAWAKRWHPIGIRTPGELDAWLLAPEVKLRGGRRRPSPNHVLRGIEVVPRLADPFGCWSPRAYDAIIELVTGDPLWQVSDSPRPQRLLGHFDVTPRTRSRKGRPWDPAPAQEAPLREALRLPA